jgi:hypothetical protein
MRRKAAMIDFLSISPRISVLPVIHGSGDFAVEVRRALLSRPCDLVALPLPASFARHVEEAVTHLPAISVVCQREPLIFGSGPGEPVDDEPAVNYVPVDPCQPVIAALRVALEEHLPRAFIDLETAHYEPRSGNLPDPYALKQVPLERFCAAVLPALPAPAGQAADRIKTMARRLRRLEEGHRAIVLVCSILDWPWIRDAYHSGQEECPDDEVEPTECFSVEAKTLLFTLGELPFVTGLYERARAELLDDANLSIDGVKELLLCARDRYARETKRRGRKLSVQLMGTYLRYVRNLALVERRMTPDLYTLAVAAQQMAGDQFAICLLETARDYPYQRRPPYARLVAGVNRGRLPDGTVARMKNRLGGSACCWRKLELNPKPSRVEQIRWQMRWNPYTHCSWPPEDVQIERFRTHVKDKALALLGMDLARSEKFTTSLRDGLDLRETLRNWHTGDLYVKVLPPARGGLDCVVMLFDAPADPRDYPWRVTWHAEHHDESTLALFASDFRQEMVGPGIGLATYGGAVFLFPPRPIPDIWLDRRLDFADTLEERVLAAGLLHSRHRHVALLSDAPPGPGWRRLARRFGKRLIHVPLAHFSQQTIQQLRLVHVLNGRHIRSYAAHFIRRA